MNADCRLSLAKVRALVGQLQVKGYWPVSFFGCGIFFYPNTHKSANHHVGPPSRIEYCIERNQFQHIIIKTISMIINQFLKSLVFRHFYLPTLSKSTTMRYIQYTTSTSLYRSPRSVKGSTDCIPLQHIVQCSLEGFAAVHANIK